MLSDKGGPWSHQHCRRDHPDEALFHSCRDWPRIGYRSETTMWGFASVDGWSRQGRPIPERCTRFGAQRYPGAPH
jgi:hypothetical protein